MHRDTQQIELLGRNILISHLLADDVEVAVPLRDRGVDLVAYHDREDYFCAVPIQLKSFSRTGFSIDAKYAKFTALLMAYVWYATTPSKAVLYVMPYYTAVDVARDAGLLESRGWLNDQHAFVSKPDAHLINALRPYLYQPGTLNLLVRETTV